jgi:Asparagine synthase (glutamine-hydrolyzing)
MIFLLQKTSELLDVNLNTVEVGPDIFKDLFKMIYYLEEPVADPAPLNVMAISKQAKEKNIKVLLSGTGGDDLFSGYRRHQALIGDSYWSWLPQKLKSSIASMSKQLPNKNNFLRRINKYFQYADLNDHDRIISYFYWINPEYLREIFDPKIQNNINEYEVSEPMQETLNEIPRNTNKLDKMLYLEMRHFLTNHNLIYNDKMGMSEGVEIRVPFLDNDLVELINSLEVHFKQKKGQNKWILKKILSKFLPNDIVYRKKTGFNLPLRNWIKKDFKEIVGDLLSEETIRRRGFFNFESVNKMIKLNNDNKNRCNIYNFFSIMF